MSDVPLPQLDIREQIARIDRNLAETEKLFAEGRKFNRDFWIVPLSVFGAILAAVVARLPEIMHAFGVGH
jgi:hypothetical protein